MESIKTEDTEAANIRARDDARQIAQGVGINFDSLQEMVNGIERKLISEDKAETATKKP